MEGSVSCLYYSTQLRLRQTLTTNHDRETPGALVHAETRNVRRVALRGPSITGSISHRRGQKTSVYLISIYEVPISFTRDFAPSVRTAGLCGDLSERFPCTVDQDGRRGKGQPLQARGTLGGGERSAGLRPPLHLLVHHAAVGRRLARSHTTLEDGCILTFFQVLYFRCMLRYVGRGAPIFPVRWSLQALCTFSIQNLALRKTKIMTRWAPTPLA